MRKSVAVCIISLAVFALSAIAQITDWTYYDSRGGDWEIADVEVPVDNDGIVTFTRQEYFHDRIEAQIECDLDATPCLQVDARSASAPWRLTAMTEDGPEVVVADTQVNGLCVRDLADRLGASGQNTLTLRVYLWGWSGPPWQFVRFQAQMVPQQAESDAGRLQGDMLHQDRRMQGDGEEYRLRTEDHPRLRYNKDNRDTWQERAQTTHTGYLGAVKTVLEELDDRKAAEPWTLTPETYKSNRPAWGNGLISVRPPEPPEMPPGTGQDPFPGYWRDLYWHDYSHWLLGAAVSDDPVFLEQCHRWATVPVKWRFWEKPTYRYFDFEASYPLQCLSSAYDVAYDEMTDQERADVREAIATIAHGLYLSTLSGHGSIYNDLRGNHTAVTMCGLGAAGLVLMDEHPMARRWVALAEKFMVDAFNEHESGAWLESPSYGAYGVNEWLRLAELLRNVTGENHFDHPFLKKFAEYQLHIADWEGRDLGYNQGGAGQFWNQWVFFPIARTYQDPHFQWLGQRLLDASENHAGYGDLFWWIDPSIEPQRPTETVEGRTFSDIGLNVWRSGWSDDATILLHHCGMKGQHKEENMNHVTLYARGQRVLPDAIGTKTEDHNVPVVDGRIQNKWMAGETLDYHSDAACGYSAGRFGYHGFVRRVLFLRPNLVVLVDELNLGEREDRQVKFLLHPNGETTVSDDIATTISGDVSVSMCTALPDGSLLPVELAERDSGRATHTYSAIYEGRGAVRTVTFLLIGDKTPPAVNVAGGEGVLELVAGEDTTYHLGLREGPIFADFSTTAPLWLARIGPDGPQRIMACTDPVMGHTDAALQTPSGSVSGAPCVSWTE
ncbi:MAG: DUF4962 domain-containing protein [Armatimonadota bacterium]